MLALRAPLRRKQAADGHGRDGEGRRKRRSDKLWL